MAPPVRFAVTSDGLTIAYRTWGGGQPIVFVRGWITHVEAPESNPAFRAWLTRLGDQLAVTCYDSRGNGLSDRDLPDPPVLDDLVTDLEAVVDALGGRDVILWGSSFGGPIAIRYAARHPGRVSRLILDGTFGDGRRLTSHDRRDAFLSLLRLAGQQPDAIFAALSYLTDPAPGMTHEARVSVMRRSIHPTLLEPLYGLLFEIDVVADASRLSVDTLVLHRSGSRAVPVSAGRQLAAMIPGARFVGLPGRAQNPWEENPEPALAAIGEFLGHDLVPDEPLRVSTDSSRPRAVMFTDIEESTAMTVRLGDEAAQEIVRIHNQIVRAALVAVEGIEVKHTGDGIMASVPSITGALAAAIAVQETLSAHAESHPETAFRVRVGINAGEPLSEDDDLFGVVVQLASRTCAVAAPGQILVTNVVREMAAGKGFRFENRGEQAVRGFDEPVRLWLVVSRSPSFPP